MKRFFVFLFMLLATFSLASAQTIDIKGTVIDENGEPVIGASVMIKGTLKGDITDVSGRFSLGGVKTTDKLAVSCIGMIPVEVDPQAEMRITLKTDHEQLDEVLVVAFGQQTKSSFTGSAAVVKSETLEKKQLTNVMSGLQGQVAGLQMINNSGSPTATPSMAIRGFSSINAGTSPLIIVDGSPYDGGWNNLNPNDVENITVLKDAASNALYGARGANGVVMITTKKGKSEKATITFDSRWSVNSRATIDYDYVKDQAQYYEMHWSALYNYYMRDRGMTPYEAHRQANANLGGATADGGLGYLTYTVPDGEYLIGTNGRMNPHATKGRRIYYNGKVYTAAPDSWLDEAFRHSLRQEYNLNLTGGTEKLSFYGSIGYLDNHGIVYNSDFERATVRLKADYQAKDWLKVGANMNYAHSTSDDVGDGSGTSLFGITNTMAPIYPVYLRDGDGNIMTDENGKMYDYGSGELGGLNRPVLSRNNPLQENALNTDRTIGNNLTLTGYADVTPLDGLKITVNGTVTSGESHYTSTQQGFYGYGKTAYPSGYIYKYNSLVYALNFQQIVNYTKQFGRHNVSVMAGHENYDYRSEWMSGDREGLFSYFDAQELSAAIKVKENAGSSSRYNTEGWFSRAMYNLDEKYFLSASYRRDASSRFHPDHRWGNFYSFGGAWIASKEDWFKVSWIDMLKVKASWGQQGNDAIGDYRYTDTYTINYFNGEPSLALSTVGNKNITWETNSNFNAGLEFDIFKSRVTGSVEFFSRKTTDMLCFVYVPLSGGYGGSYDNVGNMLNNGVELDLNLNLIRKKDFSWNVSLNATHYKNKITMLNEDNKGFVLDGHAGYVNGNYFHGEGLPLHTLYMKKYAGVNEKGQSQWYMKDSETGELTKTTTYSYGTDFNCGDADPDLYGGLGTTITFKGFDFSVNLNYSIGGKAADYGYAALMRNPNVQNTGNSFHKDLLKAWSETNTDSDIPRFQFAIQDVDDSASSMSDRFITDASTLTLQNINLGYTLPEKLVKKIGMSKIRVYAAGENLYYWSKRKGFDPRVSFWGTTSTSTYAPVRMITGGITLQF